jgi:tRNA pseudouridine55 synthase
MMKFGFGAGLFRFLSGKRRYSINKIFAVYKPKGPTSYDIIRQIKKIVGKEEKIGHAGTLDPLASGVLVIAIGRESTKKISETVKKEKEYIAKIKLGETSVTDDEEGEKTVQQANFKPEREAIERILPEFTGEIMQTPPIYSAIKVKGDEAYKLARKGKEVKLVSRKVLIKNIEIISYEWPYLVLKVVTGPGVYIRSLARDIGKKLGVGGYLADLERTRVGDFTKERAIPAEKLSTIKDLQ